MKNLKKISLVLMLVFTFIKVDGQTTKIDVTKSKINWVGKKVTGQHEGTLKLKDGYLIFKNSKVVGGNFNADMKSLINTDQTGKSKIKLEGHLKSDEFFGIDEYNTSNLVFKSIGDKGNNIYAVTADLTIKGVTNPVKFDLIVKGNTATAALKIDRTKYDIKYGSGSYFDDLGDKTIYDEFELNVDLMF
ncbi:YceI family protein [Flavobacterium sp.]|uniref:YceI family protein n=1 Tax=Flavobacterium sp. TaxID=239 RepID=UPI001B54343C|nr:YceI family protein [Flavobacterium sp.]MBP6180726.1 YceI family protein [Flavobacterium sp.]